MRSVKSLLRIARELSKPSTFPYWLIDRTLERRPFVDQFIHKYDLNVERVFHIGANDGAEAKHYSQRGIETYFFEAIPSVYEKLTANCAAFPDQHAIQACLSDEVGEVEFNVASNRGRSSSMLELGEHAEIFPTVAYVDKVTLKTERLDDLIADGRAPSDVDVAVLDVQGAEIKVMSGAPEFLASQRLKGLCLEASIADLYVGGAGVADLIKFLEPHGFYLRDVSINATGFGDAFFLRRWW